MAGSLVVPAVAVLIVAVLVEYENQEHGGGEQCGSVDFEGEPAKDE